MAKRSPKRAKVDELLEQFRISGHQDGAFDNLAAQRLGVNLTDLNCVSIIQRRGGLTAGELALEAGLTTGAITGVIDRLERAGYVRRVRDPGDRRKISVEVTPQFLARADEIWGPLKGDWDALLTSRFSAQQLDSVIEFLRLTNELGRRHLERVRGQDPAGG
jgi:DNA-binding MarR family transcriptional regulator